MARERDRRDAEGFLTLMAARRGPGRLRRGGLQGPRRGHQGQVPDGHLPALQRRAHPGLLGRDGRVRLPGAPRRLRVRRRRAQEGGLRQRHRGRRARRRGGEDIGALPPLRGPITDSTTPSPIPTRATRRATSRTRSAATGGTSRPRPVVPRRPRVQPQAA